MVFDFRREPADELPAGTRDFARLHGSLPEEAQAIGGMSNASRSRSLPGHRRQSVKAAAAASSL
jgi:hypothetical protein